MGQLAFLEAIEPIRADQIVDLDEMNTNPDKLKERFGYAPRGQPAAVTEWGMGGGGGVTSVLAAYCDQGFFAWRFYHGNINQYGFQYFLEMDLRPMLLPDTLTLAHNATIHKTVGALETLERVTRGQYMFVEAWSHFLSPIERGFSNVIREARLHEETGVQNPEAALHQAFMKYSVAGTHGHVGELLFCQMSENPLMNVSSCSTWSLLRVRA